MIQEFARSVAAGHDLAMPQMVEVMNLIVQGRCTESDVAEFLLALRHKGESVDELAGAAAALRQHMTPIQSSHRVLLDTCGTGGDRSGTFNISTAAALVTAAAGIPVAKHGNRSISSRSGSADVLATLGVNIEADLATVERCLDQLGICFCFAPLLHPSMKNVSAVRRRLGVPTIFNFLGPLCNPARAPFQLLGVGRPELRERVAAALAKLGTQRAAVLCGCDGLDEITLTGPTTVSLVGEGPITTLTWTPADFDVSQCPLTTLQVDGPAASAETIRQILAGYSGPARDIVVMNSAAALWIVHRQTDVSRSLATCADAARAAIDTGRARQLLEELAALSHSRPS
jgi:anthranilate phosphoribosyltransferase